MSYILTIRESGHSWAGRPPVTSVHESRDAAQAELLDYVRRNWEVEMGDDLPDDPDEAIREYFSEVLEAYEIREREASRGDTKCRPTKQATS